MTARHNIQTKNKSGLSFKQIRKSVVATPIKFLENLELEINTLMENLQTLDKFLTRECQHEAPSFHGIYDNLEDIKRLTSKNLIDKRMQVGEENKKHAVSKESLADDENETEASIERTPVNENVSKNKITIEQAYDSLREISVFLGNEQPQSPASTLIKIADAIGKKTFQELLEINMKSGASVMHTISELYKILNTGSENNQQK
jgi:hypothetical protein